MKYLDEFRSAKGVDALAKEIRKTVHHPWTIMEVCGGQTHAIVKYGLDRLLPEEITLIHGPGCPVCVTPIELIDAAIQLAEFPEVTLCSFASLWFSGRIAWREGSRGGCSYHLLTDRCSGNG